MTKYIFRIVGRVVLKYLSLAVLNRHHPFVVVITGDGPSGILKEAIYSTLKSSLPVRRTVESAESELTIPLTVIGYPTYPVSLFEWVIMAAKTILRLLIAKPYKHTLLIELPNTDEQTFKYWLDVTKPNKIVICGKIDKNLLRLIPKEKQVTIDKIEIFDRNTFVSEAVKIAESLGVDRSRAESDAKEMELPKSKIRILKGLYGQVIIDSTYLYYPTPLKTIEEVAEAFPGRKAMLLDESLLAKEKFQSKYPLITVNEKDKLRSFEVIIVRGPFKKYTDLLKEIT